jgi:sulfatase maturation enzyme AslB (radical SAM superfamily)
MPQLKCVGIKDIKTGLASVYVPKIHSFLKTNIPQEDVLKYYILNIDIDQVTDDEIYNKLCEEYNNLEDGQLIKTPHLGFCVITNECNMNCTFCYADKNSITGSGFNVEWIDKLKEILPKESFSSVNITGGEPLLYFNKVKELRPKFERMKIYTNGSLINKEVAEWALETTTKFYIALDYKIEGFDGHAADKVRKDIEILCKEYPKLKDLIEIAITFPTSELDNINEHRKQREGFENNLKHDFNYVNDSNGEISEDAFLKEIKLIESREITINDSVFDRYIKYLIETFKNYINVESCSPNITINNLGEVTSCMVNGSNLTHKMHDKYVISNIDDFSINKYILYAFKEKKKGACKIDCESKWICGGICWANVEYNRHNCKIANKAIFYAMYLLLNYSNIDLYNELHYSRLYNKENNNGFK